MTEDSMNMSREELVDHLKKLSEPMDLEELERKGIIKKCGSWYEIFDMKALPDNLMRLAKGIKTIETIKKGKCKRRAFVKLARQSEYAKLLKKLH
jgi:hypothetical protein